VQKYIIIQARMTSTRLPKKVMLPLCGKSVLEVMVERLEVLKDEIIIATTNDGSEEPIVNLCNKLGVRYYRGDCDDVLRRYYEAGIKYGAQDMDTIVRLTSDCPFIDAQIVQECIDTFEKNGYDYLSNTIKRTFPRGLDVEVFHFQVLQESFFRAKKPYEREHVTPFIHTTNRNEFKIGHFSAKEDNSHYRLTLDEVKDYEAITRLYALLGCKTDFDYETLLKVLQQNPFIYEINKEVEQKKMV